MRKHSLLAVVGVVFALCGAAFAGEYEGEVEGVWLSVEEIDVAAYGVESYLEYLGKGYVPMLEKVKSEGLVLDYGIMVKTTGTLGEGDVIIWWSAESLGGIEKAADRMEELGEEMFVSDEWKGMWEKMAKIRTPRSANFLRAVVWEPKEEGAE